MRVALVCHEASLTGAPRIGFDIAAYLAERHETTLLVKRGGTAHRPSSICRLAGLFPLLGRTAWRFRCHVSAACRECDGRALEPCSGAAVR